MWHMNGSTLVLHYITHSLEVQQQKLFSTTNLLIELSGVVVSVSHASNLSRLPRKSVTDEPKGVLINLHKHAFHTLQGKL